MSCWFCSIWISKVEVVCALRIIGVIKRVCSVVLRTIVLRAIQF